MTTLYFNYIIVPLLLLFIVRTDGGTYGIASNQHPFVSLLRSFPSTWPHVAAQVRQTLQLAEEGNDDKYVLYW